MKKNIIPIFFACDDKYYKYTSVTLQSIMDNACKDYQYKIYILNVDVSQENRRRAYTHIKDNFELEFVDVSDYYDAIRDSLPVRDYYTKTTYFRLFIAEMFPQYDKAIYIDSDTIVKGDISKFYNTDLGDNLVGACNEQAMIQVDLFGTYVEKNLGLDRNNYFNAGHILINCKLFREECVLDQFINLLNVYECKVTQDEDYLNIICFNRVKWIDNSWNVESFEDLKVLYDEKDVNMVHYLMWGKPWKCDSQFSHLFWKYAENTAFYDELLEVRQSVTEESLKKDKQGYIGLVKLAEAEINREDTFVSMKHKLGIKSVDRLRILKKIREYEKAKRFAEDVEQDPPTIPIQPHEVDFQRKKLSSKIKTHYAYHIARKYMNKLIKNGQFVIKSIDGLENLSNLESGAVITCNHFNALDSFAIQMVYEKSRLNKKKKRFYRVIREGNYTSFPGFYGFLMRNCYTLPLASNPIVMKDFLAATMKVITSGDLVLVYPEQSMWWNYKKPKPLQPGAFKIATSANVPVVPVFITMEETDKFGTDGFKIMEYSIHVEKPIYPQDELSRNENVEYMLKENYEVWKNIYENVYKEKLEY